jgi:hypothetical protein
MLKRFFIIVCAAVLLSIDADAQTNLKGKVFDNQTDSVLVAVSIVNITKKLIAYSDSTGQYTIPAAEGDKVIFSSVSYSPDTTTVAYYMLVAGFSPGLNQRNNTLANVTVRSSTYQEDSLNRRNEYREFYSNPKQRLAGSNTPTGFGITFSPVSYFSKREKQKRELRKRLARNEEIAFVDFHFSRRTVEKLTGLQGDSLSTFMLRYRPSYEFCRKASQEDMLVYINDKLKEFKQAK